MSEDTLKAVSRIRALAFTFDSEADYWRQKKKEAEVREIWYMNRASALREAAGKVEKIAQDYGKQCEES
ncbi:hypothetical protein [Streptomyces sp. SID13726]|uniref:hypothetical protein n=1 Tax=Streptomyces sp. SID13726 TaxID=2706058 RepID=UPI0013BC035A|nr:hypothetical protein [Streptomyces sp. SID13726]NEB04518.1 hypothetical protein [Streptomyces sp. SID13726]